VGKTVESYRIALEMLKKECPDITNSEILMIGDSIEQDIVPAKKLGLKTALAKYGQKTPRERPMLDLFQRFFRFN
jgi:FMN phosphatase YigB (HAD superfamily)